MYDVIALGELLVDLAERAKDENGYPTLAANPGGAPGNFSCRAERVWKEDRVSRQGRRRHLWPSADRHDAPRRDRHARHSDQPRYIHDACVRDL